MTMDYMGFRTGYQPSYDMHNYHGPAQAQNGYPYMTYDQQHQMVLAQLQHQRAAAMMSQGSMSSHAKPTESKPRLAKDEVDTLEREFQKNPKPNSSLKRELADQMRVDVARINNWFQNRRAKAKQIKKTQEFEAQQAAERAASSSESPEDQSDDGAVSEFYGVSNHNQAMQPSSASFSDVDDSLEQHSESAGSQGDDANEEGPTAEPVVSPLDRHSEDLETPQFHQDDYQSSHFQFHTTESPITYDELDNSCAPSHTAETFRGSMSHIGITIEDHSEQYGIPISRPNGFDTSPGQMSGLDSFGHFSNAESLGPYASSVPNFPSRFLHVDTDMGQDIKTDDSSFNRRPSDAMVDLNHLSPASMNQPSPISTTDLRFKSPPSPPRVDIATRRNLRRPAQLNPTAFRTCSYGPKTGIEMPKRSEATSPMRRIASASGPMPCRIQKPTLGLAPRSPMFSDRNKEAFLQSLQGALSPVTPNECFNANQYGARENTASSSVSDDELKYNFGAVPNSYFHMDASHIRTPPGTPSYQQPRYPTNALDAAWNFVPSDEALVTPGLGSFESEVEFPAPQSAPGYAASQPVTPSFARPAFYPVFTGNGASNLEYKFPDSASYGQESSARSSPILVPGSKNFQFTQNITPQDFSS